MTELLRQRTRDEQGFTLIELLVVILIIGILAAIAIPSFLNQREKAQDTCAKNQVRTMSVAMETYYTDGSTYSNANFDSLFVIESAVTGSGACGTGTVARVGFAVGVDGQCDAGAPTADSYCVSQSSIAGGATPTAFAIAKAAGQANVRTCGPASRLGSGGCPPTGRW
jgi:type IV pilus assembly protein PilA